MTSLDSPFLTRDAKLTCRVDQSLVDDLFTRRLPLYGARDRVLAHLLHTFYQQAKTELEPFYSESNEPAARAILERIASNHPDRNSPVLHDSGGTPIIHHPHSPAPNLGSDPKSQPLN